MSDLVPVVGLAIIFATVFAAMFALGYVVGVREGMRASAVLMRSPLSRDAFGAPSASSMPLRTTITEYDVRR